MLRRPFGFVAIVAAIVLLAGAAARALVVPSGFVVENAVSGSTFKYPTGLAFLPDGRFIVTEEEGKAWMVVNGVRQANEVWNATGEILSNGDRGLLGVAVDPKYFVNHFVYFLYSVDPDSNGVDDNPNGFSRLARYTMRTTGDTNTVDPASRTILIGVDWRHGKLDAGLSHSIGSLRWGRDGSLLVSAGEGADFDTVDAGGLQPAAFGPTRTDPNEDIGAFRAQDVTNICGKILRINPANGHGYASNPFADGDLSDARSRVWEYGMRNPYRFTVRPGTGSTDTSAANPGSLYIGDVGWGSYEELNVAPAGGRNFGWPCNEGFDPQPRYTLANPSHNGCGSVGTATNPSSWSKPVASWHHSQSGLSVPPGTTGSAIVAGAFYTDSLYPGAWRNRLFIADFVEEWIQVATFSNNDHFIGLTTFGTGMGAPVSIDRSPIDGNLYYASISTGEVRRIRWTGATGGNSIPVAKAIATPASGPAPLTVAFTGDDSFDPDGNTLAYAWTFGDGGTSTLANPSHLYAAIGTYVAKLTVNDGRGGVSTDSVTVSAIANQAFPTTAVIDNFNRANGALAAPWVGTNGVAIASNRLSQTCCYATPVWTGASFGPEQEAFLTLSSIVANAPEYDLMLKVQGTTYTSAHIEVRYDDAVKRVAVATYDAAAGGWVDRGAVPTTFVAGDRLGARAHANGTVDVFKNTTLLGTISTAGWAYNAQGGSLGLTLSAIGATFDDFGGGTYQAVSASPVVTVTSPNGGESWVGGSSHDVQWTAVDDVAVTTVDVYYKDHAASPWVPLGLALPNTGHFTWFVQNTPASDARVRVIARDGDGHATADSSDANFTITATPGGVVPTTLRDFLLPGTQPLEAGGLSSQASCNTCHSGYSPPVEPGRNWKGSMMAQAAHDPIFYACLAIAEQDAPSSGDLCIRCHSPLSWLAGRSQPTSGARIDALGREGLSCDFCHRMVDPIYQAGVSPAVDQPILAGMLPSHVPTSYGVGQYVIDPNSRARGPFADALAPHEFVASPFHTRSEMCATCHDVSNPVFDRVTGAAYAPGPLDTPADTVDSRKLMPLERTYSEWRASAFPQGVTLPEFAGNAPGGVVSACQDCHMRQVTGAGCNSVSAPVRGNLPLHDFTGGNAWMGGVIASLWPSETDPAAIADARQRAVSTLQKAADVQLSFAPEGDSLLATVRVVNRTGHKLPTGYPEGRRMWLDVVMKDAGGNVLYRSCPYDSTTGVLAPGPLARVYEMHLGVSKRSAAALGLAAGPTFHFTLNDSVYKDNRIPPLGFTNAAYDSFGGTPVDDSQPSPRYPDGQNWDASSYPVPKTAVTVTATLWYQTTSKDYVEFLQATNASNTAGQAMYDAWTANGRSAPVAMESVLLPTSGTGTDGAAPPTVLALQPLRNPSAGPVRLALSLPRAANVRFEIFDVTGRAVFRAPEHRYAAGVHALEWDGRVAGRSEAGAGAYWAVATVDGERLVRRIVRLR